MLAQQFVMQTLPSQKRLPQSELYRVFEDSEGYMWYATRGAGLCRDNGFQIDVFRADRNNPGLLRSNVVTCIAENVGKHEIWFGTKQGAYVLNKRDYSIKPLSNIKSHIHEIVQTPDNCMWVALKKQVKVFSPDGEPLDSFALSWKGEPMSAESMTLDSKGTLWIMQWDGGVQAIDTRSRQMNTMNWEVPVSPTSLAEDSLNHLYYIGTWGAGVFYYDGRQAIPLDLGLTTDVQRKVRCVKYDPWRHMLWVVTMAGLYAFDIGHQGILTPVELGLPPQQAIFRIIFDHNGYVWVPGATPQTFILRPTTGGWLQRSAFDTLAQQVGSRIPVEKMLCENEYCWIWSDRTQLLLYNRNTRQVSNANGPIDNETTRFGNIMALRKQGGIWCATGRQIFICKHQGMKVDLQKQTALTLPESVSALCEAPDGSLYIGTGGGLYLYKGPSATIDTIARELHTVRDIAVAPDGTVFFISTAKGICKLSPKSKDYRSLAPYQRYTALTISDNGQLWTGNAFGEVWMVDDTLHYCPIASSREGNGVKQLVCDSLNHLWVMGDTYLTEYHPESDRRRLFQSYDPFIDLDNFGGMSLSADGQVVVVGSGGMIALKPKMLPVNMRMPVPAVAAYTIDGKKQLVSSISSKIEVPAQTVTLELQLTCFSYLKAGNQQFAYRLKGLSSQWMELPIGENTLQLVNLPKGNYTLELKACDPYAHWGDPVEALVIHRQPAWYETWFAYLCYVLLAAAIIVWLVHLYLKRNKEKARQQMDEQLTEMKLQFFTNISHELRTPLSLIITPLESIIRRMGDPEQRLDYATRSAIHSQIETVIKHANHLLDMVNRLLDFRKLNMGELKLHPSLGDLYMFLRTCISTFKPLATSKGLALESNIPDGVLYTSFDAKAMQNIMYNLLSNAIKYTTEGSVTVEAACKENQLTLKVSDTGVGIAASELPYIFKRYYQASNAQESASPGTGIGLSMVKDLIEKMDGTITANSTEGEGSCFTITLPIEPQEGKAELPVNPVIPKLPSVLIADDNDDFRDFLVQELKNDYNILQARNGREALRIAQTQYIDVILSDVMMPQMNGNELCRQLKQDESTSHIFIMLLTAKTAEESMLESYEAGADFYLTKPFSMELLRNRLQHLTHMQERRIELLAKAETQSADLLTEDELRISPIDRKFMEKMTATMEQHIADTTFSVDTFCAEMAMSRMNFYRKMHALTGKTPAQYINDYRLSLADRLLREGELNVSEVADRTGFSTASYFSKCYKIKFGVAPKEARQK